MCEAVRIHVRYELPDENGQTRRERNADFGVGDRSPPLIVPPAGRHLWEWYFELSESVMRVIDGVTYKIPPTEVYAEASLAGRIVYPDEYAILRAMDRAFCSEMAKEVEAFQAREQERRARKRD